MKNIILNFYTSLIIIIFLSINTQAVEISNTPCLGEVHSFQCTAKGINKNTENQSVSNDLQLMEIIVGSLAVALAMITIVFTFAVYAVRKLYDDTVDELKSNGKKIKNSEANIKKDNQKLKNQIYNQVDQAEQRTESQYEDIEILSKEAHDKLEEAKMHLKMLDETDKLITIKISAMQKTLIACLDKAPDRDAAFSIYSKLLSAYEILLEHSPKKISPILEEKMQIAATIIQSNRQYVSEEIIKYMIEYQNLPYDVRGILRS